MKIKRSTILEHLKINEAKADDEYAKSFSSIERPIFDAICLMDPKTQRSGDTVINIGFGAKQLLLPKYMSGETAFVDRGADVTSALTNYYPNIKNYPKFPEFESVEAFLRFMENPVEISPEASAATPAVDKITEIYNQYYSDIPREVFDEIISMDPETTDKKIGDIAKNLLIRCYRRGERSFVKERDKVEAAIERFNDLKSTYEPSKQNIMNYETLADFMSYVPESPLIASLEGTSYAPVEGTDYIHVASSKNYDIFKPLTFRGSERIAHARGAQNVWCTAGGSDGVHYGATPDHARPTSFWNSYSSEGAIYMFMHKSEPTNRKKNYNMSYKPQGVYEFRDGDNQAPNGGRTIEDGIHLDWEVFLLANPDVVKALAGCSDPTLANDVVVKKLLLSASLGSKPLVINTEEKAYDVIKNRAMYKNLVKEITVKTIKKVPDLFANNFAALEKLTIGEGVEVIGLQAFKNCSNLATISQELPEGLKTIEMEAFMSCTALKGSIHLPESLTDVKLRAFDGTRCKLKIDRNRTTPIRFSSADRDWVNAHVLSIKK